MSTATTTTTSSSGPANKPISIEPTPPWQALPIEGSIPQPYKTPKFQFEVTPLHPTFACELNGVEWKRPITQGEYNEIRDISNQYGVIVCRDTGLTDDAHVEFSSHFGELDDVKPYIDAGRKHRLSRPELFDAGNIDPNTGDVAPLSAAQVIGNKANEQFHVDSSFNARRAGHSLLLAHILPPAGTGGATEFADSRTAYDDLSPGMKKRLDGLVANHSLFHSRKKAVPEYFVNTDPMKLPLSKHQLVQKHEWSGRMNLYIASYVHHIEDMDSHESRTLIDELLAHISKPKYRITIPWEQPGDMIIWDNTAVLHRATGGSYEGREKRDMRRTTVKDMSSTKYETYISHPGIVAPAPPHASRQSRPNIAADRTLHSPNPKQMGRAGQSLRLRRRDVMISSDSIRSLFTALQLALRAPEVCFIRFFVNPTMEAMTLPQHSQTNPNISQAPRKPRGKYVSRACVECRQRKLKCSGEEPCHRCVRRGHQCVFSDDRAVQEVLRRTRRQLVSGDPTGTTTLDTRVERLEKALQTLTERLDDVDNGSQADEPEVIQESSGFQGDTAFQSPVERFNENLAHVKQQLGFANGTTSSPASSKAFQPHQRASVSTLPIFRREQSSCTEIRIGTRALPFPSPLQYRRYLDFFFADINASHPAVNETDFRARSEAMLESSHLDRHKSCFLALHYMIFACADILQDICRPEENRVSPGSRWYMAADELIGRTKYNGQGDLSLIQFLVFEALYLVHEDKANHAYNISGLACRLCFQFGLHEQSRWEENEDSYYVHMKQRILWTTYFVDRRIALSCGRPYGMADRDIVVDLPAWISDREVYPGASGLPAPNVDESFMPYLACMVQFAKLGGEIWDELFSAGASKAVPCAETIAILDAKVKHWSDHVLPTVPLTPPNGKSSLRHNRQSILVSTRVDHLRLLLRRQTMISMTYSAHDGRICGELAMHIVQQVLRHSHEASEPSSYRFHMAVSLGGAVLVLSTLLCRPLCDLGLEGFYTHYVDAFRQALILLRELGTGLSAARRVLGDLGEIIRVVERLIDQPAAAPQQPTSDLPANIDNLFPYGAVDFAHQAYATTGLEYGNFNGWASGDDQMYAANPGYGAPWI